MLSGPAAITGQLPGRSSYNNSVDTDVYGELSERIRFCCVVIIQNSDKIHCAIQIQRPDRYSKTTRNTMT